MALIRYLEEMLSQVAMLLLAVLKKSAVTVSGQHLTNQQITNSKPFNSQPFINTFRWWGGGKYFFSFDIEDVINGETEITLSQISQDVFLLERQLELYEIPRQHNRYGSGDLSDQLVDDLVLPIYRVITRSLCITMILKNLHYICII